MWREWLATLPRGQCLLRALRNETPRVRAGLTDFSRLKLQQLIDRGLSLRQQWPRGWYATVEQFIGQRLYLTHSDNFSADEPLVSVVSSALGRGGRHLQTWPLLLDQALQRIARQGQKLLVVPKTTTSRDAAEFAQRAELPRLLVEVEDQLTLDEWLKRSLQQPQESWRTHLRLSPALIEGAPGDGLPLQDRLAILLADVVMALRVRHGGTVAQLLKVRLAAPEIPLGATFCALLPNGTAAGDGQSEVAGLMDSGAVGWIVLRPQLRQPASHGANTTCRRALPATCHITARLPSSIATCCDEDEWPWLTHCTRGMRGPLPSESDDQYRDRLWLSGTEDDAHPLQALIQICSDGHVRGSTRTTRTDQPSVSLSAVPLTELLSRRIFRPHLGRWDWEPYGVVIRREAISRCGGRQVLYGSEVDYKGLDESDRPFFQPARSQGAAKRSGQGANPPSKLAGVDWTEEREWRLMGNLRFRELDVSEYFFFVLTARESQQLARIAPAPVYWVGGK